MTVYDVVELLTIMTHDASVYIDMSGAGGPYLLLDDIHFYANGPNGEAGVIFSPSSKEAHSAVRRQLAAMAGERLRKAIAELIEIEVELG